MAPPQKPCPTRARTRDQKPGAPALLYIDLHLTHEVTSPQAFSELRERGLKAERMEYAELVLGELIGNVGRLITHRTRLAEGFELICLGFDLRLELGFLFFIFILKILKMLVANGNLAPVRGRDRRKGIALFYRG